MDLSRRSTIRLMSASLPVLAFGSPAWSATVVKLSLWDKGPEAMDMPEGHMPMGMAMAGAGMDMVTMGITADIVEFPAGEVTFKAVNESQEFYHSMVISPVQDVTKALPYLTDKMMVDEEAAGRTGVLKELRPHASGSVTLEMTPGTYILYCNIAGHYIMGMWTLVTVTG